VLPTALLAVRLQLPALILLGQTGTQRETATLLCGSARPLGFIDSHGFASDGGIEMEN